MFCLQRPTHMPLGPWKINVGSPPNTYSTELRGLFVRIYGNDKAIRFFRTDSLRYVREFKHHTLWSAEYQVLKL